MKKLMVLLASPLIGGILGWVLSGSWRLGATLFVALATGNFVNKFYKK
jgi:hypothetical protein